MSDYTIEEVKRDLDTILPRDGFQQWNRSDMKNRLLAFIEQQAAEIERLQKDNEWLNRQLAKFTGANEVTAECDACFGKGQDDSCGDCEQPTDDEIQRLRSELAKQAHKCGLNGYDPMKGDYCPACDIERMRVYGLNAKYTTPDEEADRLLAFIEQQAAEIERLRAALMAAAENIGANNHRENVRNGSPVSSGTWFIENPADIMDFYLAQASRRGGGEG